MIDGTRKDGVYLEHELCGIKAIIPWAKIHVTGDFSGTYGEFNCPGCGQKLAVFTIEPISEFLKVRGESE